MNTTAPYTGADTLAVLDSVAAESTFGENFAGVEVGQRRSYRATGPVHTTVFASVDDALDYLSTVAGRDVTLAHNRKTPVVANGKVYAFRLVKGLDTVEAALAAPVRLTRDVYL